MRNLRHLLLVAMLVVAGILNLSMGTPVYAESNDEIAETGCGLASAPYYTGTLNPPADTYDVYVKLGKPGEVASVSGYIRFLGDDSSLCENIGTINASGNEWRKLGTYKDGGESMGSMLQLSSPVLNDLPDANRPSLMLVSHTNPVCVPKVECITTINGLSAYIRPAGTSLEDNMLHIVRVGSVDLKNATKVQYYADNELLYETKTLQEFNQESIPFYANKLIRVVHYASGQMAVIETQAPDKSRYDLWASLRPYVKKYSNSLILAAIFIGIIIVIRLIAAVTSYLRRRRRWRLDHGFIHEPPTQSISPEQIRRIRWRNGVQTAYRYVERTILIVAVVAGFVFITNSFVLQIGTVSGLSMYATLNDGQKILINKLPVTFAQLNNTQYVPKRGAIIVASPNFGTVDTSLRQDDRSFIVKRVCGLPGERVVVDAGAYTIYNQEHPRGFDPNANSSWSVNIQPDSSTSHIDVQLAESELFLCGDNYPVSIDSRYNGPISTSQVVGAVGY